MLLARFFLQRIMFIKFISTLPECIKICNLTAYIPLFVMKFAIPGKFHHKKLNISSIFFVTLW